MGVKTIETRSWATHHRGSILVHASRGKAGSVFASEPAFKKYIPDFNKLPFGAIIGAVSITAIVAVTQTGLPDLAMAQLTMEEKAFGDYTSGRFAWLLSDAVMFTKPVPARGMLNVWDYSGELPGSW